ncbi:hypothetical protein QBC47DRAFT_416682 [Echria macrotheca]|uniref:SET domain-containing protein n=1 Tax=Echria macrotheca TaxID=438768 RepID=A0AAJ0F8K2_9PEZI|nr:hypothetical protein QBC47DRAFT_416682 [Echria macrotheca]
MWSLLLCVSVAHASILAPLIPEKCPVHAQGSIEAWSRSPICSGKSLSSRYCVFTSSEYNNGHGISVITPPESSLEILGMIQNSNYYTLRHKHHLTQSQPESRSYEVKETPGRGRGVFARQTIPKGQVFLTGFPALLLDQTFETEIAPKMNETERTRLYGAAFEQLPHHQRLSSLATSSGEDGSVYEDIVRTNGFGTGIGTKGKKYSGIFPEIARLNHGCRPNAIVRFSKTRLSIEAITIREIQPGEELTISYIPPDLPTPIRQSLLKTHYFFTCTCALCSSSSSSSSSPSGNESDENRQRINQLRSFLESTRHLQPARDAADELLALAEKEGLDFRMREYLNELMLTFYRLGDLDGAVGYAEEALRRAVELGGNSGGGDGGDEEEGEDEFVRAVRANLDVLRAMRGREREL